MRISGSMARSFFEPMLRNMCPSISSLLRTYPPMGFSSLSRSRSLSLLLLSSPSLLLPLLLVCKQRKTCHINNNSYTENVLHLHQKGTCIMTVHEYEMKMRLSNDILFYSDGIMEFYTWYYTDNRTDCKTLFLLSMLTLVCKNHEMAGLALLLRTVEHGQPADIMFSIFEHTTRP